MIPTSTTLPPAAQEAHTSTDPTRLGQLLRGNPDAHVLIAAAQNRYLTESDQLVIANSEYGDMRTDPTDPLSTPHAALLARADLQLYPARIIMDNNTPDVLAAIQANLQSPTVFAAAKISHVKRFRALTDN